MMKEDLEYVEGLTKAHEEMWIKRNDEGKIEQVFDIDLNPIDTTMLYRSFIVDFSKEGFMYRGEFIEMADSMTVFKQRSLGNQRRRSGHYNKNKML